MLPTKRKPTHPGVILKEEFLKPLNMNSRQFAEKLGSHWSEVKVEAIISGKENISTSSAEEFATALGTTSQFWKQLQNLYTQWEERHLHHEKGSLKHWKKAQ